MAPLHKKRVSFHFEAPAATEVCLVGDFNNWDPTARRLKQTKSGVWTTWTMLPPGAHEYRYLVDGEWAEDPCCEHRVPNAHGTQNCVVHV